METERIDPITSIMTRTGTRRRALQILTTAAAAAALVGPAPGAAARTRTVTRRTSYTDLICTIYDEVCDSAFSWDIQTRGVLELEFIADTDNCTPMRIWFTVDDEPFGQPDGYIVAAGERTGFVSEGPVAEGKHRVKLLFEEAEGGACPANPSVRFTWSGALKAKVSARSRH